METHQVKMIVLKESFLKQLNENQHVVLLATVRIYSVVAMKCKIVADALIDRKLNGGAFIDLYSDLFATYFEGAKKYFQEYSDIILEVSGEKQDDYARKMRSLFLPENAEVNSTYKVLNFIRNDFSFHFGIRKLEPIVGAPIGMLDDRDHVTFTSTTPNLFRYIADATGQDVSHESITTYYRTVYNEEIRPFVEYLKEMVHQIVDNNVDFI